MAAKSKEFFKKVILVELVCEKFTNDPNFFIDPELWTKHQVADPLTDAASSSGQAHLPLPPSCTDAPQNQSAPSASSG